MKRSRTWMCAGMISGVLASSSCSQMTAKAPVKHEARESAPVYENRAYGFRFDLPEDWKGYQVVSEQWEGTTQAEPKRKEHGPKILLRDPRWTTAQPRQDIPIMVFTLAQWNEDLVVSAAPIGPSELGRNSQFVFALPPRYNYAFPEGYEEVENILKGKPLHTFAPGNAEIAK
ncbi:hypothetical protein JAO29_21290 [Edaphobacter sp. HDX4]|uniref:hypothetical protein n=1 Tax=Edaphobacter sp. HDX4 TaxID=2794064 RepID=UPI002FE56A55